MKVITEKTIDVDFAVVGGGLAGLLAAVAAARNGTKTVIVQDRPMFGGNSSSEIRMWICGAQGENRKETGLLEELELDNLHFNPTLKYTLWDDVMYSFAKQEKNLTMLLNTTVESVQTENNRIVSISAWNLNSYTRYHIEAAIFADCSGDGILRLSGAPFAMGREASATYNESYAPATADAKTMGSSILMQLRKTNVHRPFIPPPWAYKYTDETVPPRDYTMSQWQNFWWLEFGGVKDTIADADEIRDELYKMAYGVWAYMKNHPNGKLRDWELDWIGSLPGKRESVRFIGDVILTQQDIEAGGNYPDTVCYGGWTMDDHHPEAFNHFGAPNIFHPAPSPFGIPLGALYSSKIENLMFAGRHISVSHMGLSSIRVMGTTALMGQAVGTAAALAIRYNATPRAVRNEHIAELQQLLMEQDIFLPGFTRKHNALTQRATPSSPVLMDGFERDWDDGPHAASVRPGESVSLTFASPETISGTRIVFDSDLNDNKRMRNIESNEPRSMPAPLARDFKVEVLTDKGYVPVATISGNYHRLVRLSWPPTIGTELKLTILKGWSDAPCRIFALDAE